ncbi:MAG: hypothetical protein L0287_03360 [Anaerolineae bacterium]|nr:hypothetical protein [Anaerolineae bacterium]MCI0608577.1 hypothetical protein [Anaerolineae bacterium]
MKRILPFLPSALLRACFLLSFLTACAAPPESTPTPYPDTPSPAEINAPLIESPALVSIQFLNEIDGWGVTETQIVRTNDGGVTWYNITPPEVTETGYLIEMFILDNNNVWLQKPDFDNYPNKGFLYHTTDGGITWVMFTTPFSGGDNNFLDANNGWMLADLGVGAGSNAVSVYQTTDGGETWDQIYTNDPNLADSGDSLPLAGIKSDLTPLNTQTAWVGGVVYSPGEIYLFRTEDAGRDWVPISLPLPSGAENFELSIDKDQMRFVTASDGFLALRMAGDITQTAIYVTHDAGDTWLLTPTIISDAGSADFLSANEAVVYNGNQFYVTRDAARTWTIIPPDVKFGDTFAGMDFVNTSSGWVITLDPTNNHYSLYRTSDGGATWFPVVR